jgi:predicted type IV restriction endonuclease
MPPKPFYEIEQKTYLFGKATVEDEVVQKRRKMPEEKVRQWVLFELLSTYGYNIKDIKIEVASKMGRGYQPADIVIYNDHQPFIVIECKKVGSNEQEEAIKQVITYATGLKTQFAIYTDGQNWIVKRLLSGHWIDINDIPPKTRFNQKSNLPSMLWFVSHIQPLLFWIYRTVPAEKSPRFFRELDTFTYFVGFTYLRDLNDNLHLGINSLVKILFQQPSESNQTSFLINEYRTKNFLIALSFFQKYFEDIGQRGVLIENLDLETRTFNEAVECLYVELNSLALNLSNIFSKEVLFLRFGVSLLRYLSEILEKSSYHSIEPMIMADLFSLINLILITDFGVELPNNLDSDNIKELYGFSSEVWIEKDN